MTTRRNSASVLAASERVAWYLIEVGNFSAPVSQIATAIDVNERTFYRYFPTKPDALRPLFDWGAALLADRIAERTDLSVKDAALDAFAEIVDGQHARRTRLLFPLVFADTSLRAVLLAVYHDAEAELRGALSRRTGLEPGSLALHGAAARIVMSTRLALELHVEQGLDPVSSLRELLTPLPDQLVGDISTEEESPA
ncbi:AcrR family transcriptional regulator [Nocardioides sp. BE266]|uniref:TetR/AcrR family transcriptional regulator n=1 Tax=Nocardioides sp. BE266 TaxID=2817725 RepID=UPI002860757B|nr:hypothetical protein [Nocardioides sp. BE266]MDR7254236.1 AcrR family transcriptional regulator [Nocardioides sp. BE266]